MLESDILVHRKSPSRWDMGDVQVKDTEVEDAEWRRIGRMESRGVGSDPQECSLEMN